MSTVIPSKIKRPKALVIVVVAVIVVGSFLVYWLFLRPQAPSWLFDGAYAKYYGETSILLFTVKVTCRLEVMDFNNTHARMHIYMKAETPLGTQEFQNTTWADLGERTYEIGETGPTRRYEEVIYIEGIGTRDCIVYEYSYLPPIWFYVDKEIGFPIKMKMGTSGTVGYSLDLNLVETNIPGLKE